MSSVGQREILTPRHRGHPAFQMAPRLVHGKGNLYYGAMSRVCDWPAVP
jgi:hypothetical protein